jgi:hypothetical protein
MRADCMPRSLRPDTGAARARGGCAACSADPSKDPANYAVAGALGAVSCVCGPTHVEVEEAAPQCVLRGSRKGKRAGEQKRASKRAALVRRARQQLALGANGSQPRMPCGAWHAVGCWPALAGLGWAHPVDAALGCTGWLDQLKWSHLWVLIWLELWKKHHLACERDSEREAQLLKHT